MVDRGEGVRLVWDRDAEIDRIMALSDDELIAEAEAEGRDWRADAEEMRQAFMRAFAAARNPAP